MRKNAALICLAACLLPAWSLAEVPPAKAPVAAKQAEEQLKPGDVLGIVGTVGMLGAIVADATVGEALVRAYPSKVIAAEGWSDPQSSIKLSCDTYRNITGNRMIAAAGDCQLGYLLVAKSGGYTLSGPLRPTEQFEGRSCEVARKACDAYQVTVTRKGKLVELRDKKKLLGTLNFSGQTPQYTMAK